MRDQTLAIRCLWLTFVVVALDILTKQLASHYLELYEPVAVMTGVNLTLAHNYGAAFSFLGDAGGWQRWFLIILSAGVSVLIVVWLFGLDNGQVRLASALSLILGGAIGNLIDRVFFGYVVDFIDVSLRFVAWKIVNPWPTFNVADAAITLGAILLIIDTLVVDNTS